MADMDKLLTFFTTLKIKKALKILLAFVQVVFYSIVGLLVTYAVVFSIVGTVALYKTYTFIRKPVEEVKAYRTVNPEMTSFMKTCLEKLAADSLSPDTLLHAFIPLDSISPNLKSAVVAAEDDGFYLHPGVDIASILAATKYNRSKGKNRHGASTITQQMAKNLFLGKERTFERKVKELLYAMLMERYLGKDRILELYLNYAQWGKNIFGCEAASRFYYKKSAAHLTRSEAARLAAVLAKPARLTPYHTKSIYMGKRLSVIARNLYMHNSIDDSGYFAITGTIPPASEKPEAPVPEKKQAVQGTTATDIDTRNNF